MPPCSFRLCSRILPNFFVIGLGTALFICAVFYVIPDNMMKSSYPFLFFTNLLISTFFYIMWLWSWFIAIAGDPGRTIDDLKDRGVLKRVLNGDIPNCLRHLQICPICSMPRPPLSEHCKTCGYCHLRRDHHCGVTGQCVADKNMKGFILSFFYSALFSLSVSPAGAYNFIELRTYEVLSMLLMIYGPTFFFLMTIFGFSFLYQGMRDVSKLDEIGGRPKSFGLKKYLKSFGNSFQEKIIPYQRRSTQYAWIGVNWEDENVFPL
ncbi:palmitoyltransferase swf1 [Tritrichomonas musculus]|uniref:Palmitoyltransferase n=1 Tax=Tritrichomonas musculus TaxID=1915356 RepID=A0ABR2KGH7_9EUKA